MSVTVPLWFERDCVADRDESDKLRNASDLERRDDEDPAPDPDSEPDTAEPATEPDEAVEVVAELGTSDVRVCSPVL